MFLFALLLGVQITPAAGAPPNRQPQLAASSRTVGLTYGAGNAVYFASSNDSGATFGRPVLVSSGGQLSLGMHRGPRLAYTAHGIVISAIVGEHGKGRDGDLVAWRSKDGGKTWSSPVRVNDVVGAAREGLHAMAAGGRDTLFATWLDLRGTGTRVYGATSRDGGETWSANRLVYASPSGTVCQCCHPSSAVDAAGNIWVMFRNSVAGSRDLYRTRSADGGATFETARKLGSGTWKLEACPMDGGDLSVDPQGRVTTVWRREETVFQAGLDRLEQPLGPGRNPTVRATRGGVYTAWTDGKALLLKRPGSAQPKILADAGAFPSLAAAEDGSVLVAWESEGVITVRNAR